MNLHTSKIELVKMILNIENPNLLSKLLKLAKKETPDFWLGLSEEEKEEINLGSKQLDSGEKIPFNDFLRKVG